MNGQPSMTPMRGRGGTFRVITDCLTLGVAAIHCATLPTDPSVFAESQLDGCFHERLSQICSVEYQFIRLMRSKCTHCGQNLVMQRPNILFASLGHGGFGAVQATIQVNLAPLYTSSLARPSALIEEESQNWVQAFRQCLQ